MIEWSALILPSLVATALVFVASSLIHMVLRLHQPDYRKLGDEEAVASALRKAAPAPGQYVIPHCARPEEERTPEFAKRLEEGPIAVIYIGRSGAIKIGPFLGKWMGYVFVVSLLAGYLARAALPPSARYLAVFQVVGAAAWLAYSWQSPSDSIWKSKPWSVTLRGMFDGLVYAALTAGAYAWLWPDA